MIRYEVEVDNRDVLAMLARLQEAAIDLTPAFRDIGEYLIDSTRRRFAAGVAPDGTPWAPNRPSTLARKSGAQPLIGESKRLSREFSYQASADALEFGSSLEYAATQQFGAAKGKFGKTSRGAPIPFGDIPPRPYIGLAEEDSAAILAILGEHLTGAASG